MCNKQVTHYGFTYKKNGKNPELVTEQDYDGVLKVLNKRGKVIDFQYEKDKNGRMHIHGVWENTGRTPLFSTMCPGGFHSHFEEVYDLEGWQRYIYKDYFKNNLV